MGMFFNGTIASMPAKLDIFDGGLQIIRPLIYVPEQDIVEFAKMRSFPEQIKRCKYEQSTNRNKVELLLKQIEQMTPEVRESLFASINNIKEEYLPLLKSVVREK